MDKYDLTNSILNDITKKLKDNKKCKKIESNKIDIDNNIDLNEPYIVVSLNHKNINEILKLLNDKKGSNLNRRNDNNTINNIKNNNQINLWDTKNTNKKHDNKKVIITLNDILNLDNKEIVISKNTIITPLGKDYIRKNKIKIINID